MNKKTLVLTILVVTLLAMTALPALASGISFPIHGPGDLNPNPFKTTGHPAGCFSPLVLNQNGQCALPGMNTPPDPRPHRIGF